MTGRVYLDHAATSPLRPEARAAMLAALDAFGNPSSVHREGQDARYMMDRARRQVSDLFDVRPERVVLASGGTEANNLALRGVMAKAPGKRLLVSQVEHDCVRNTARALAFQGVEVVELPVDANGVVRVPELAAELARGDVALVSVMLVNNETGVVQPVGEIADIARKYGALVHTDAVQAVGHMVVKPEALGVDLLSFSGHKFGGPKGVGGLVLRPEIPMETLIYGGAQERNRRAGTENVAAVAGLGAAAEVVAVQGDADVRQMRCYRDAIVSQVVALPLQVVADPRDGGCEVAPHIVQFRTPGRRGEDIVIGMDVLGVAVSQGSACSSGRVAASHVLQAMGYGEAEAGEGVRLSFGWSSTMADVDVAAAALARVLA